MTIESVVDALAAAAVFTAWALTVLYVLWLFYLAVMNLKRAKDAGTLTRTALFFGRPILFVGLLLDLVANLLVATVVFVDMPDELTVTARLKRYVREQPGTWRGRLAAWFAAEMLDTFDPSGKHI